MTPATTSAAPSSSTAHVSSAETAAAAESAAGPEAGRHGQQTTVPSGCVSGHVLTGHGAETFGIETSVFKKSLTSPPTCHCYKDIGGPGSPMHVHQPATG
jgi:hypothetical protein